MIRRRKRFARALGVVVDHELQGTHDADAAFGRGLEIFAKALLQNAVVNPAARHAGNAALFHKAADRRRGVAAAAQADQGGHAGIVPAVHELFIHELDELALAEHHVGEAEAVEFMLMREKEEVLSHHRRQRRLQKGREVLRMLREQQEEGLPRLIGEVFRPFRGLPLVKDFAHRGFRSALSELRASMEGGARKRKRPLVPSFGHGGDRRSRFFKLRCAQDGHHALQGPVIEGALVFKFERADGVSNVFKRILDRMRKGVHRINAPLASGRLMLSKANAVDRRVSQIHVGRSHVDLRTQNHGALRVLPGLHLAENPEVLFGRAAAEGRILAGLLQGAAVFAHLVRALLVYVRVACLDQVLREFVHPVKVVRSVVKIRLLLVLPVKAEPVDALHDAVHVLLIFLHGVRVVKAHVAVAAELLGKAEIKADALGVADVKIAVGLGRKARADLRHVFHAFLLLHAVGRGTAAPLSGTVGVLREVRLNERANEIHRLGGSGRLRRLDVSHNFSFTGAAVHRDGILRAKNFLSVRRILVGTRRLTRHPQASGRTCPHLFPKAGCRQSP